MASQDKFIKEFTDSDPERRSGWVETLLNLVKKSDSIRFLDSVAEKLEIAARIDDSVFQILDAQGQTLKEVLSAAYLKLAKEYFRTLDEPMHFEDKTLLLGKFQPSAEFDNYHFRLEELRFAMQKAGVGSVLDAPNDNAAAMEEAIAETERHVHLERARSWYSALQVSSLDDDDKSRKVNPMLAVMRLQYHVQQSGGDYAALDPHGDDSADTIKKYINTMAGQIWLDHYSTSIPKPPQITDEVITPDQNGRYNGIYVFSAETDATMTSARLQCDNFTPDVTIHEIIDATRKTGLPLSELFPESGLSSQEIVALLRENFIDTILEHYHEVNPHTLDHFGRKDAIAEHKVMDTLNRAGFNGLTR